MVLECCLMGETWWYAFIILENTAFLRNMLFGKPLIWSVTRQFNCSSNLGLLCFESSCIKSALFNFEKNNVAYWHQYATHLSFSLLPEL